MCTYCTYLVCSTNSCLKHIFYAMYIVCGGVLFDSLPNCTECLHCTEVLPARCALQMYVLYILYDIYNAYIVYGIIYTLDALCTEERGSPCRVPANICPRISWLFTKPGVSPPPPPSTPEYHSRAKPATKPKTSYKICQFLTNAGIQASIAKPNQNPQCQLIRQLCIRPGAET